MAVTVTLELTDGQWALVLEHYIQGHGNGDESITTVEELASSLLENIKRNILKEIDNKASQDNQNAFDV